MNRKNFIKKSIIAGLAGTMLPASASAKEANSKKSTYDQLMNQVGFNHLPNQKEIKTMNTVLHKANTRGSANHGWLEVNHSFSFASYYNPERTNFGVLRVLNDDKIAPSKGLVPTHTIIWKSSPSPWKVPYNIRIVWAMGQWCNTAMYK